MWACWTKRLRPSTGHLLQKRWVALGSSLFGHKSSLAEGSRGLIGSQQQVAGSVGLAERLLVEGRVFSCCIITIKELQSCLQLACKF